MTKKTSNKVPYENNPFFIASNGVLVLFNLARRIGIFLVALSFLLTFLQWSPDSIEKDVKNILHVVSGWSLNDWVVAVASAAIIGLALALVASLINGVSSYTSAQLAKGKEVGLRSAFQIAFENLWSFLWLQVIVFTKIILWTLLFIVPGIVMSIRYSLAGVAFYDTDKDLRGNAAIKESLRLTKNAWLTTFSANLLFNLITFGVLGPVVSTAVNTTLYRQFDTKKDKKPKAHWLSWAMLVFSLFIVVFFYFEFVINGVEKVFSQLFGN